MDNQSIFNGKRQLLSIRSEHRLRFKHQPIIGSSLDDATNANVPAISAIDAGSVTPRKQFRPGRCKLILKHQPWWIRRQFSKWWSILATEPVILAKSTAVIPPLIPIADDAAWLLSVRIK